MSNFKKDLLDFQKKFNPIFERDINDLGLLFPDDLRFMYEPLRDVSLSGGKRIRPYVLFSMIEQGYDEQSIMQVASFVELIHLELLVIDDFVDRGDERHGVDTVHASFLKQFSNVDHHFSDSVAVILGVMIGHFAQTKLAHVSTIDPVVLNQILAYYNQVIVETSFGQLRDVWSSFGERLTRDQILETYRQKTALYTFEGPMILASILEMRSKNEKDLVRDLAKRMGIIFQITDDLISIFSSDQETGKNGLTDYLEGKQTLVVYESMQLLDTEKSDRLWTLLRSGDSTGYEEFRSLIVSSGAENVVRDFLSSHADAARQILDRIVCGAHTKRRLRELLDYLLVRTS